MSPLRTALLALGALAAATAVMAVLPGRALSGARAAFVFVASRRWAALGVAAGIALAGRLALLPLVPVPRPAIPDEFSYLLLAETLEAGKLANLTHPLWRHFETLFVLQRPSYASMYPPAQGAVLALGNVLAGHAWWGVWLSAGIMCAAVAWMLRAWLPPAWALYGALLLAAQIAVFSYWSGSYWGGAPAAIGGALVLGAAPRMLRRHKPRDAVALGLGLFVLASSRPYEGLLLSVVPVAVVLIHGARLRAPLLRHQLIPFAAVGLLGGAATLFYCFRVTGSFWKTPQQAYIEQYAASPAFVWQRARPAPAFQDPVLREAHLSLAVDYQQYRTLRGTLRRTLWKLGQVVQFYFGPLWPVPLILLPWIIAGRALWVPLGAAALCVAGDLLAAPYQSHYPAPATAAFCLLLTDALRRLWERGHIGRYLVPAAPLVCATVWLFGGGLIHPPSRLARRVDLERQLRAAGGHHLVIVRYGPRHALGEEWVYNQPDIDRARVVWARDLGREQNRELLRYFRVRRVWLLLPDEATPRLTAYPIVASGY